MAGSHHRNLQIHKLVISHFSKKLSTRIFITIQHVLEWIHTKSSIHSRAVGQESSESRFEQQTEVQDPVAAKQNPKTISFHIKIPKSTSDRSTYFIPWCTMELRRVLHTIKSAHCTTTIAVKKAVWQVYSNFFLSA